MDSTLFTKIYICCLIVGLALPALGLIFSGIGNWLDFDFDFDGDTSFDTPFPVTPMVLALAAAVFGAVGWFCSTRLSTGWGFVVALASGLCGGGLLSFFVVRPLKQNHPDAQKIESLTGCEGRMKLEARAEFTGTVSVLSSVGSLVTYSARPAEGIAKIAIGTRVRIVDVIPAQQLCIVVPLDDTADGVPGKFGK